MQTLAIIDTHFYSLKTKRETVKKKKNRKGNWNNNTYDTTFC